MVVALPEGHPQAGRGPLYMRTPADRIWVEDNDGSAALLRRHAARAGATARIDLTAAGLLGKIALVATGHAIASGVQHTESEYGRAVRLGVAQARLLCQGPQGKTRWVVERTFAWLHQFKRLRIRYETRADLHLGPAAATETAALRRARAEKAGTLPYKKVPQSLGRTA